MKKIIILLLMLPISIFSQDKVKFIAAGVTCSMCSNAIHKSLKADKNIIEIKPNLETQEWLITYKTGTFLLNNLQRRVEAAGFSISKVWFNDSVIYSRERTKRTKNT
jgi:copper chaperone CopZ